MCYIYIMKLYNARFVYVYMKPNAITSQVRGIVHDALLDYINPYDGSGRIIAEYSEIIQQKRLVDLQFSNLERWLEACLYYQYISGTVWMSEFRLRPLKKTFGEDTIDSGSICLLKANLHLDQHYFSANASSFSTAAVSSFLCDLLSSIIDLRFQLRVQVQYIHYSFSITLFMVSNISRSSSEKLKSSISHHQSTSSSLAALG